MNNITASQIVDLLKRAYPDAKCSLDYKTPLQLAIATILSAQSTDERVNLTTPILFRKYRSLRAFAEANPLELELLIKQVGLYRNKAKSIIRFAKTLQSKFGSEMPQSLADLQTLPGVGRKTANVIQGVLFDKAEGIAVDTHVSRLSFRLGFTRQKNPAKIETELKKWISPSDWVSISHLLIRHGREVCKARNPQCDSCFLNGLCPRRGL